MAVAKDVAKDGRDIKKDNYDDDDGGWMRWRKIEKQVKIGRI